MRSLLAIVLTLALIDISAFAEVNGRGRDRGNRGGGNRDGGRSRDRDVKPPSRSRGSSSSGGSRSRGSVNKPPRSRGGSSNSGGSRGRDRDVSKPPRSRSGSGNASPRPRVPREPSPRTSPRTGRDRTPPRTAPRTGRDRTPPRTSPAPRPRPRPPRTIGNDRRPRRDYVRYRHRPHTQRRSYVRTYRRARNYYRSLPVRWVYQNRWVRVNVTYVNGYYWWNDYPYYVYDGYAHRYGHYDVCNYELVDSYYNEVYQTYYGQYCHRGYDNCAELRDELNWVENDHRYFCAERHTWEDRDWDDSYDWSDDDWYEDDGDWVMDFLDGAGYM